MTDYTDLKRRLRGEVRGDDPILCREVLESAAAIEALEAEIARLQVGLEGALTIPYWGDVQDAHSRIWDILDTSRAAFALTAS